MSETQVSGSGSVRRNCIDVLLKAVGQEVDGGSGWQLRKGTKRVKC